MFWSFVSSCLQSGDKFTDKHNICGEKEIKKWASYIKIVFLILWKYDEFQPHGCYSKLKCDNYTAHCALPTTEIESEWKLAGIKLIPLPKIFHVWMPDNTSLF